MAAPDSVRGGGGGPKMATEDSTMIMTFALRIAKTVADSVRHGPQGMSPRAAALASHESTVVVARAHALAIMLADSVRGGPGSPIGPHKADSGPAPMKKP
ncbi:MAG: hypothetical protein M3081_07555 [Gemmatimonadota bacterium]|nr:hypothetical protein [Gemmatimonadota bacterium]